MCRPPAVRAVRGHFLISRVEQDADVRPPLIAIDTAAPAGWVVHTLATQTTIELWRPLQAPELATDPMRLACTGSRRDRSQVRRRRPVLETVSTGHHLELVPQSQNRTARWLLRRRLRGSGRYRPRRHLGLVRRGKPPVVRVNLPRRRCRTRSDQPSWGPARAG